jgi:hypothetical protein
MNAYAKPRPAGGRAAGFLQHTVVGSMEGVLFALLSTLLTLAGVSAFFEDAGWPAGIAEATASAPAVPTTPAVRPPAVVADARAVAAR